MMLRLLIISAIVFNSLNLEAGEIVFSGTYQGSDIFIQNPFDVKTRSFCTQIVYVNDREVIRDPKVSALRIDLSHLPLNDLVVIRIVHRDSCTPRVVNPHVLKKVEASFSFLTLAAESNAILWTTQGESKGGHFILEHWAQEWDDWEVVTDTIEGKGSSGTNQYAHPAKHQKGENRYRVSYYLPNKEGQYSVEAYYTGADYVTFYPEIATTQLTLSDSAEYVITDFFGKEMKKGNSNKIAVQDLKPGEYYITINNRKDRFIKK